MRLEHDFKRRLLTAAGAGLLLGLLLGLCLLFWLARPEPAPLAPVSPVTPGIELLLAPAAAPRS